MKSHDWYDITTLIILGITLTALIIYTGLTYYQASIARDTARRQLRAYVGINAIDIEAPNLKKAGYEVPANPPAGFIYKDFVVPLIKNFGQTPASDVLVIVNWIPVTPFGYLLPDNFPYQDYSTSGGTTTASRFVLDPGQIHTGKVKIDKLKFFRDAQSKATSLYIYGHIDYTDIYNRRWQREFSYAYEPWRPEGDRFVPDRKHNGEKQIN